MALAEVGSPSISSTLPTIKSGISRYGADKQDIQLAVQSIFNLPSLPRPDDAADGIVTAYTAQCGDVQTSASDCFNRYVQIMCIQYK